MVNSKLVEDNNSDTSLASQHTSQRPIGGMTSNKRKSEEYVEKKRHKKRAKAEQKTTASQQKQQSQQKPVEPCDTDGYEDEVRSNDSTISITKKKKPPTTPQFRKLQEIEDKSPLCVIGETEANIFPRKLKFMNHTIDVIYDSRVHIWLKADDFAKALGYKNHKSVIERYVNPSFVRTFPEVLDMSRTRYGDAFRLYSVNSKVLFINEAGTLQLLLRSMISNDNMTKEDITQKSQSPLSTQNDDEGQQDLAATAVTANRGTKHHPKPKLSADWINYQILPSLVAFSEAAKNGITAREERHLQSINLSFNQ